ncbi:MAG: helix-turn-helix domain-containing protein [Acidimicrobiales bacterium]
MLSNEHFSYVSSSQERDVAGPEYRAEYERPWFANDIADRVLRYRTDHDLTQTDFVLVVSKRQAHVARLVSGEHVPSHSALGRLA